MQAVSVIAHYWVSHCEHCRPFPSVRAAIDFLRQGRDTHSLAIDRVTLFDGTIVLSREDLHRLLGMPDWQRQGRGELLDIQCLERGQAA